MRCTTKVVVLLNKLTHRHGDRFFGVLVAKASYANNNGGVNIEIYFRFFIFAVIILAQMSNVDNFPWIELNS